MSADTAPASFYTLEPGLPVRDRFGRMTELLSEDDQGGTR